MSGLGAFLGVKKKVCCLILWMGAYFVNGSCESGQNLF